MAEPSGWGRMALVGTIARAHGRWGQVVVNPETDYPEERFRAGSALFARLDDQIVELRVTDARFQRGRPIIGLDRIRTMTEAARLAGTELRVPESTLHSLPTDAYYEHDLVGCIVRTVDGTSVGTVSAVQGPPGAKRLILGTGEVDVPLVDAICVDIDLVDRAIVIDPPAGLLELNRALSSV